MNSIKNVENTIIINKSKFITNLFYVENVSDVESCLKEIKSKYKDATHHCYAYIINNIKRFNDDYEPSGTAGMPILECLEKNNLNCILAVVTRYFGGIKLGTGGLLRAYTSSFKCALDKTEKFELINGYLVEINFSYDMITFVDKILSQCNIIDKSFNDTITYNVECDNDTLKTLKQLNININIKKEAMIKHT